MSSGSPRGLGAATPSPHRPRSATCAPFAFLRPSGKLDPLDHLLLGGPADCRTGSFLDFRAHKPSPTASRYLTPTFRTPTCSDSRAFGRAFTPCARWSCPTGWPSCSESPPTRRPMTATISMPELGASQPREAREAREGVDPLERPLSASGGCASSASRPRSEMGRSHPPPLSTWASQSLGVRDSVVFAGGGVVRETL